MCFGKTWCAVSFLSLVLASAIGIGMGAPATMIAGSLFLSIKELIQFVLYDHMQTCDSWNKWLTVAAWIHISFQPMFVLLYVSAFSRRPALYALPICLSFLFAVFNVFRIRDIRPKTDSAPACKEDTQNNMCRLQTCSHKGRMHVAYGFELATADVGLVTPSMFGFMMLMFAVPLLIGDWEIALINGAVAIAMQLLALHDAGEAAAMWCLNSFWFGLLLIYYCFKGNPFSGSKTMVEMLAHVTRYLVKEQRRTRVL